MMSLINEALGLLVDFCFVCFTQTHILQTYGSPTRCVYNRIPNEKCLVYKELNSMSPWARTIDLCATYDDYLD